MRLFKANNELNAVNLKTFYIRLHFKFIITNYYDYTL